MTEEIMALAATLSHPAEEQRELLGLLCTAAERELRGRLKEGCRAEDCGESFLCAAALLAAADFRAMMAAGGDAMSFTAGSVSVSTGGSGEQEKTGALLRRQARRLLAGWLRDDGFAFQGVKG